jgi:hypothetical protein
MPSRAARLANGQRPDLRDCSRRMVAPHKAALLMVAPHMVSPPYSRSCGPRVWRAPRTAHAWNRASPSGIVNSAPGDVASSNSAAGSSSKIIPAGIKSDDGT